MPGKAAKVVVSERQFEVLKEFSASRTEAKHVTQRAAVIVQAFGGAANQDIARVVGLCPKQVGLWRKRWQGAWQALCVWECSEPQRLREAIREVLADAARPGAPATFTAEQVAAIVAVSCESPKLSGRPISKWTHRELRDEVLKRGIVASISLSQVGRILADAAMQPHRRKMWLNTTEKCSETFEREKDLVCQTYLDAPALAAQGTHTVSVDEATGLQALERNAPLRGHAVSRSRAFAVRAT